MASQSWWSPHALITGVCVSLHTPTSYSDQWCAYHYLFLFMRGALKTITREHKCCLPVDNFCISYPMSILALSSHNLSEFPCLVEGPDVPAPHFTGCFWSEHVHPQDFSVLLGLSDICHRSSFLVASILLPALCSVVLLSAAGVFFMWQEAVPAHNPLSFTSWTWYQVTAELFAPYVPLPLDKVFD